MPALLPSPTRLIGTPQFSGMEVAFTGGPAAHHALLLARASFLHALLKTQLFLEELLDQPEEPEQQHSVCF